MCGGGKKQDFFLWFECEQSSNVHHSFLKLKRILILIIKGTMYIHGLNSPKSMLRKGYKVWKNLEL
jgi:hypothetical protein